MTPDATPDPGTPLARAKAGELLGPQDLMAIFHLKPSRFYELKQRGEFDRFLVDRPIAGRAAYAGARVYRYVLGEVDQRTFGRKSKVAV